MTDKINIIKAINKNVRSGARKANLVLNFIKGENSAVPWLGTFHSISVKFIRRHAEAIGFKSNFTILDTDDQKKLVKRICEAENIDAKKISPQFIMAFIDGWKNKGLTYDQVKIKKSNSLESKILKVYEIYQNKTKSREL